jgi:predicted Holliday junction resolvase-like endonuclease
LGFLNYITVHNIFLFLLVVLFVHILYLHLEFKIKLKDALQYNDENLDKDINDLEHKISKIYENKAKERK